MDRVRIVNTTTGATLLDATLWNGLAVAAGGTLAREYAFALPHGAAGVGELSIEVMVDSAGSRFEHAADGTGESNNSAAITRSSTLAPYADLAVSAVTAPATALPGTAVTVTWTVSNVGDAATSGGWTDRIFLSDDASPGGDTFLASAPAALTLAPGASVTRSAVVTIPTFVSGPQRFVIESGAGRAFFDPAVGNNVGVQSAATEVAKALFLSLSRSAFPEGTGSTAASATVTRNGSVATALVVALASSDTGVVTVQASVTIPAGAASATFAVTAVANAIADGDHSATIAVSAAGFEGASAAVTATDDDTAAVTVSIGAASVAENGANPVAVGTVTRNTPTAAALVVALQSDLPGRATVPATVTIPAGAFSATFPVSAIDNALADGAARVSVLARATGHAGGSASVIVTDDDVVALDLSFTARTIIEGAANAAAIGTVTRSIVSPTPLVVVLSSADPSALGVPATVTIPANRASAQFTVRAPDDLLALGTRTVALTARATGPSGVVLEAGAASATLTVLDDDGARLVVSAPRTAVREGTSILGTVTRNTDTAAALVVALSSSDTSELTVPATVTIPAGEASVTFPIQAVLDGVSDGTSHATISAEAAGNDPGSFTLLTTDVDLPDLRVALLTVPATGLAGHAATVSWTVVNGGTVTATGTWNDRVFIRRTGAADAGTTLPLATQPFSGSLAVGESYTASAAVTLPMSVGEFEVLVITDGSASAAVGGASAGLLAEGSETNNTAVSTPIILDPAYRATVATAVDVGALGQPVPITGTAYDPATGAPAAGVAVTVRVGLRGTRRVIEATTDASGAFAVTFQPLPQEAGQYSLAADHPAVAIDTPQDGFVIHGLRAEFAGYRLSVVPGTPETRSITLANLGDLPLTGLTVEVLGAPTNLEVTTSSATTIPAGGTIPFAFTVAASATTPATGTPVLRLTTAEGATIDFPLAVTVRPLTPRFLASPGFLSRGMVRGETTTVSFDVVNSGGAPAADVRVLLPDVPWMRVVAPAAPAAIAAGGRVTVTLALSPAADLPLGEYPGSIAVIGQGLSEAVEFRFRAVSTAVGDLVVDVQDEFTFYQEGRPQVAGAEVILRDPYTAEIVARATTGAAGSVAFSGIAEGRYLLEVDAAKHGGQRVTVDVVAGTSTSTAVFLQRQTVSYRWRVTPTEIEDVYTVVLDATFDTSVPAPVVRLTAPARLDALGVGETAQIDVTAENLGLIAAENFSLAFQPHPDFEITPLGGTIPVLAARSALSIPVLVKRVAPPSTCADIVGVGTWEYVCGNDDSGAGRIVTANAVVVIGVEGSLGECTIEAVPEALATLGTGISTGAGIGGGEGTGAEPGRAANVLIDYERIPAVTADPVPAQVRVRLDQTATLTRSAFTGSLEIDNGHQSGALTGLRVSLDFRDAAGNSVNDRFFVQTPRLSGLDAVDGTGTLAAGASGLASYTIIPRKTAAPTAPVVYTVGGSLRFVDPDSGAEVVLPLLGATITVHPDPSLELDYFWQRDVYGDDPFTEAVEPSEPFAVGLLVTNAGRGAANDFVITSAQPRIVENEKGLLIDYAIIGTQVGTNPVTPSLTVDFGDIGAGETVVGQWLMESSLQGKFVDFMASFAHSDDLGGASTSLIDTVRIHELIRAVRVAHPTDDGRPDFLANDVPDADHLPDTLWFGTGGHADVGIAEGVVAAAPAAPGSMSVTVTATMPSGWGYLRVADPGAGYRVAGVLRSDGRALPTGSYWQTDRSFPASGSSAVREHLLHILDENGTGEYTVSFILDDDVAPAVIDVVDVAPDPHGGGLDAFDVVFSEPIDPATFTAADILLTRDAGANLLSGPVTITQLSGATYRVSGLAALTGPAGVYTITVAGSGISDFGGNAGTGSASDRFAVGDAAPFVDAFGALAAVRASAL
ncbi:MAG: hypothetical protein ACKO3G_09865, partial [Planctomycetaceae bacterium]